MDEREMLTDDEVNRLARKYFGPNTAESIPETILLYTREIEHRVAARRTMPDREAIIAAARDVIRDALDDVVVHPCDVHNDDVKAAHFAEPMRALYLALKTAPTSDQGEKS